MIRWARFALAGVCGFALASGCAPKPVAPSWQDIPVVQIVDRNPAEWKLDPFTLDSVKVDGDSVRVAIAYGGGCASHTFALFMRPAIIKTNPAQVELLLRHNGHGDACKSLITGQVAFDITPIQRYMKSNYAGDTGAVFLNLFRFAQDRYVQVRYPAR